jgi:hypothetical protein
VCLCAPVSVAEWRSGGVGAVLVHTVKPRQVATQHHACVQRGTHRTMRAAGLHTTVHLFTLVGFGCLSGSIFLTSGRVHEDYS